MVANQQIRKAAKVAGVKLWEVATRLGTTDSSFSRKLRQELPADETKHILAVIQDLAEAKGAI